MLVQRRAGAETGVQHLLVVDVGGHSVGKAAEGGDAVHEQLRGLLVVRMLPFSPSVRVARISIIAILVRSSVSFIAVEIKMIPREEEDGMHD